MLSNQSSRLIESIETEGVIYKSRALFYSIYRKQALSLIFIFIPFTLLFFNGLTSSFFADICRVDGTSKLTMQTNINFRKDGFIQFNMNQCQPNQIANVTIEAIILRTFNALFCIMGLYILYLIPKRYIINDKFYSFIQKGPGLILMTKQNVYLIGARNHAQVVIDSFKIQSIQANAEKINATIITETDCIHLSEIDNIEDLKLLLQQYSTKNIKV